MPSHRQLLQVAGAVCVALAPAVLPAHVQPTLLGRRAAMEIVERTDQHAREHGLRNTQIHRAAAC